MSKRIYSLIQRSILINRPFTFQQLFTKNTLLPFTKQTLSPFNPCYFYAVGFLLSASSQLFCAEATIETITVTALRVEQSPQQLSSSFSVISTQALEHIGAVHISQALTHTPGVWINRGNGQEHLTAIRSPVFTGAGSCSAFYIAEDTIPVRAAGFCNVNQLFDINTEQAKQVEVLRGPGTVLQGSNALHGAINVVSKAPSKTAEQLLSLEVGPHDYGRLKFSTSNSNATHGYRVNFNSSHDAGYKDDSGFDQQKMTALHLYQQNSISIRSLLSINNLNQNTAGYAKGADAYKQPESKTENSTAGAYRDSQSFRLQSRIKKQLDNKGVFIVTPYVRYTEMNFLMHFLPGTPIEENGQQSVGVQTSMTRKLSSALTLTQGFDTEYTSAYLKQSQAAGFSVFPSGKQYDYDVSASNFAIFLNSNYKLSDAATLDAGARYETLDYHYKNKMLVGSTAEDGSLCINTTGTTACRYSRPDNRNDHFDNSALTTGLIYHFNDQISINSRLAHGFRAPQATELYRLQVGQLEADLDSEQINSVELGIRAQHDILHYAVTVYYMKKNNVIFQSPDRLNLDDGKTEHKGLEYQLALQLNQQLTARVSGSFARHLYSNNVRLFGSDAKRLLIGNDIDTAPRNMMSVQLQWQITTKTLTNIEWVYMGRYFTDIDNLHQYDGHAVVNGRLRQQWGRTLNVGLRITNLTNVDYAERADFTTFGGERYFVGEPRAIHADLSIKF